MCRAGGAGGAGAFRHDIELPSSFPHPPPVDRFLKLLLARRPIFPADLVYEAKTGIPTNEGGTGRAFALLSLNLPFLPPPPPCQCAAANSAGKLIEPKIESGRLPNKNNKLCYI